MVAIAMSWDSFVANGQANVIIPANAVKAAMVLSVPVKD
jgi:hypothetical protein